MEEGSKTKTSSLPLPVVVHRLCCLVKQNEPERGFGKIECVFGKPNVWCDESKMWVWERKGFVSSVGKKSAK
ncbi:uncharacterized protein G2W53_040993 [Senna tora]|uniref:Uncharacterized protein n=1 Tax=Senna tora TaxID=362788 RepID=A0A834SEE6_9FABA|nr:uncharacterized protein G2W53_040993 [Senna tora]